MKTLAEEWQSFEARVYPHGMAEDQRRQIHQAFFAGAFVTALQALQGCINDVDPYKAARELTEEARVVCAGLAEDRRNAGKYPEHKPGADTMEDRS